MKIIYCFWRTGVAYGWPEPEKIAFALVEDGSIITQTVAPDVEELKDRLGFKEGTEEYAKIHKIYKEELNGEEYNLVWVETDMIEKTPGLVTAFNQSRLNMDPLDHFDDEGFAFDTEDLLDDLPMNVGGDEFDPDAEDDEYDEIYKSMDDK